jgi:hypothetical protein
MLVHAKQGLKKCGSTQLQFHSSQSPTTWRFYMNVTAAMHANQAPAVPKVAKNSINAYSLSAAVQPLLMRLRSC